MVASDPQRTVALIGMMGVGKSTVGRALAAALGRDFVDLDALIEAEAGCNIRAIFARDGEAGFRSREARSLVEALSTPGTVLACGGGVVVDAANRAALAAAATVVWLTAAPALLMRRLGDGSARPLAGDEASLRLLLRQRRDAYATAADVAVDAGIGGADDVARRVVTALADLDALTILAPGHDQANAGHDADDADLWAGVGALDAALPAIVRRCSSRVAVVSDTNVWPLHADAVASRLQAMGCVVERHTLPAGEADKTLATWSRLVESICVGGADRDLLIVAVGGGVVCDVTGFAAATALRGVRHVLMPTTLLAQVDAAIGGKTGVDTPAGKNLVGAFYPPIAVVADARWLHTLPPRERAAGLAEAVKTALVTTTPGLFAAIESSAAALRQGEAHATAALAARCAIAKRALVRTDPREHGPRRALNFGHSLGHALEREAGFGVLLHGEAVAVGMRWALDVGVALGLTPVALRDRVVALLLALGLPVDAPPDVTTSSLLSALRHDKKANAAGLRFILVADIGTPFERSLTTTDLAEALGW